MQELEKLIWQALWDIATGKMQVLQAVSEIFQYIGHQEAEWNKLDCVTKQWFKSSKWKRGPFVSTVT